MGIKVCIGVNEKCWNTYASYGEICVGCGCCSKDKKTRYESRISALEGLIEDSINFDIWANDENLKALQEKNIASSLKTYKRMLRYYKKKLQEMEE